MKTGIRRLCHFIAVSGVIVSVLPLAGFARDASPEQVIFARKANERELGGAYAELRDELKKKKPLQFLIREYAGQISSWAQDQSYWYPEGSGPASGEDTNAKPEIWTEREEFDALYSAFLAETAKLYKSADTEDNVALATQLDVTGQACVACHERFKTKDEHEFEF